MGGLILSMIIAFCIMGLLWFLGGFAVLLFQTLGLVAVVILVVFIAITIVVYLTLDS
jgi:hypothetical protein